MPKRASSAVLSARAKWRRGARPGSRASTTINLAPSGATPRPWAMPRWEPSRIRAARRKPMSMRTSEDGLVTRLKRAGATFALFLLVMPLLASCGSNAIPTYEQQAKAAWAEVQNQYQRRADLIPNLVATVKGAANFESKTLEAVVEARAKVGQTQLPADILTNPQAMQAFEQDQAALTSALSRLLVVSEHYPALN